MHRIAAILLLFLLAGSVQANEYKYFFGLTGGKATIASGDSAKYTLQNVVGLKVGYIFNDDWRVNLDLSFYDLTNDTTATSSFALKRDGFAATRQWQAKRVGLIMNRRLFSIGNRFHMTLGVGAGWTMWKIIDASADSTIDVQGIRDQTLDFAASEVFVAAVSGFRWDLGSRWSVTLQAGGDYLTGAGAEFAPEVVAGRDRWLYSSNLSLSFAFGRVNKSGSWPSNRSWLETRADRKLVVSDTDHDGVPDEADRCLNTPLGAIVDRNGCPIDSDHDGVSDGLDDCPGTESRAGGMVDINGCPVDSDFDGIADYIDACPHNPVGAAVDESGCVVDSDGDGVPDGLDDCPLTLVGVDVDRNGCIDLSMLAEPMVLNIDYPSGSFEIDPRSKERLIQLSRLLNFVSDIRLDISGYTDNIGTTLANRTLSEKRARRVRDFLVTQGISTDRIKAFGRGESNFVASNQNAKGRAKNRRIEIIFLK